MKIKNKVFNVIVIVADILLINLGFYIAFMMKFDFNPPQYNMKPYLEIIPFITVAALLYFDLFGLLSAFKKSLYDTIYSTIMAVMLLSVTTIAITYINQGFSFPRSILLTTPVIQISLLTLWKMMIWEARKGILNTKKVLLVGKNQQEMDSVVEKIKAPASNMMLEIKYTCDDSDIEKVLSFIDEADEVFISFNVANENKEKIIIYCMNNNKGIYIVPDLPEILLYKSQILQFDDIPTFAVDKLKLSIMQRFVKRAFDIVFSLIAVIISSPIMLLTAIVIKMSSKGPAFFTQERVTIEGKSFKLYKFRTMITDAEKETGPILSVAGDDRITPEGNVLRKTRIDELPQFINVLKGEMSVVGPRPERPHFVEQFKKEIPGYEYRTSVKAGITGLAQVIGKYATEPEDKLRYDLFYIKNYSILFDVKLILQTLNVFIVHKSAEGCKAVQAESGNKVEISNALNN